ncbi:MAG TPA: hypothetical protein VGD62_01480, partial [Acidobacteriaceae bacterium]
MRDPAHPETRRGARPQQPSPARSRTRHLRLLLCLLLPVSLHAQSPNGSLQGLVRDQAGARVSGATA